MLSSEQPRLAPDDLDRAKDAFNHSPACQGTVWASYVNRLGSPMLRCRGCERIVPVARLLDQLREVPLRRYVMPCIRCDQDIRLYRPKPRIPLHESCARRRRQEGR